MARAIALLHRLRAMGLKPFTAQQTILRDGMPRCALPRTPCRASSSGGAGPDPLPGPRLSWPSRTHGAGTLRVSHIDERVRLCGWVDRVRDLGALTFLDIRDHTGVAQVVVDHASPPALRLAARRLRGECVVAVDARVRRRSDPNPSLPTGLVEAEPTSIQLLNGVEGSLPITVSPTEAAAPAGEETRLRHRVLDLRHGGKGALAPGAGLGVRLCRLPGIGAGAWEG